MRASTTEGRLDILLHRIAERVLPAYGMQDALPSVRWLIDRWAGGVKVDVSGIKDLLALAVIFGASKGANRDEPIS